MQPVGLAELDSDLEILKADIEADKALPTVGNTVQTTCVVSPTICLNGGACEDMLGGYKCTCATGFALGSTDPAVCSETVSRRDVDGIWVAFFQE